MNPRRLSESHRSSVKLALAIVALPVLLLTGSSHAQDIYAYPAKGQSQAQQDRDRYECHSWAVKQTGFDPSRAQASAPSPPPSNQPLPPQGHIVKGAARGSALGAVGGAITGNAGKGAAGGAAMGGLAGGMRRRPQRLQRNQQKQQATSQVKEVELVVAPAIVMNSLAEDHHPQVKFPHFKLEPSLETGN